MWNTATPWLKRPTNWYLDSGTNQATGEAHWLIGWPQLATSLIIITGRKSCNPVV